MGHATATAHITANTATSTRTEALLSQAVRQWYDEEASRYDSENAGPAELLPMATPAQLQSCNIISGVHGGRSLVIPVVDESDAVETTRTVRLDVDAATLNSLHSNRWDAGPVIWEMLRAQDGHNVVGWEIKNLPAPRKAVAAATEGKAVTDYEIHAMRSDTAGVVVERGIATQALAREKAIAFMNNDPRAKEFIGAEVHATVHRDTGSKALVTIARPAAAVNTVELKVKYSHVRPGAQAAGWTVAFGYHM